MDDDGTRENKVRRDGDDRRGANQTHGAGDASGVDAEPDIPQRMHDPDGGAPPPAEDPPAAHPS